MKNSLFTLLLILILFLPTKILAQNPHKIQVAVSIPPQKYFVEQIAGNKADTIVIIPKGFEPEDYEPRPQQLKALNHTHLYLAIGVPFETAWLNKIQNVNPRLKIISTNKGIQKIEMLSHEHHHPHEHSYSFQGDSIQDPHIWLSPKLVQIQAKNIRDAFIEIDPENAAFYHKNYAIFRKKIKRLDRELASLFSKITPKEASFLIFHPSLGYFAKDYHLTQIPIEMEGKSPTLKQLNRLAALAQKNRLNIIFVTPEYSPREAEVIAKAIGGKTQLIDPLSEEWLNNLKHIGLTIFESIQPTQQPSRS